MRFTSIASRHGRDRSPGTRHSETRRTAVRTAVAVGAAVVMTASVGAAAQAGNRVYADSESGCVEVRIRGDHAVMKFRTWGHSPMFTTRVTRASRTRWTGGTKGTNTYRTVIMTRHTFVDQVEGGQYSYSRIPRSRWRGGCPLNWNSDLAGAP